MPRSSPLYVLAAAGVSLATITACSSVVSGHGAATAGSGVASSSLPPSSSLPSSTLPPSSSLPSSTLPASSLPSSPASFPSSPPSTPASSAASSSPPAPALHSLLLPRPHGAVSWGDAWSRNESPTVTQWVAEVYPASSRSIVVEQLQAQGLQGIAHRTWIASDDDQADVVLLRFGSTTGALERYNSATQAKGSSAGITSFAIPGAAHAVGYAEPKVDSVGNIRSIVYALHGSVVVEVFYYSPKTLKKADAITWTNAQLARLP